MLKSCDVPNQQTKLREVDCSLFVRHSVNLQKHYKVVLASGIVYIYTRYGAICRRIVFTMNIIVIEYEYISV